MNPNVSQGILSERSVETWTEELVSRDHIMIKRLAALFSVKSLVTLILTVVFAYQSITGTISQDFMTIYAVIIAFYFGTQSQKVKDVVDKQDG